MSVVRPDEAVGENIGAATGDPIFNQDEWELAKLGKKPQLKVMQ